MSNYLAENQQYKTSNAMLSSLQPFETEERILRSIQAGTRDTIAASQKSRNTQQAHVGQRPSLPPAQKSKDPDYLAVVAAAFAASFRSMAQGTMEQAKDYAQLQQLTETMSQSVLRTTKLAIDKEQKAFTIAQQVADYQKHIAKEDKILNYVMMGVGALIMLATIASSLVDAGASLLAVPEEAAMLSGEAAGMGSEVAADTSMFGDIELTEFPSSVAEDSGEIGEVGAEASEAAETAETQSTEEMSQAQQQVSRDLDRTSEENTKSEESFRKRAAQMAVSAVLGIPSLVQGLQSFKTANLLNETATAQQEVGYALATMQENQMYFRFDQQLVQRSGGVAQEESNDASQIVETFADITNAIQHISSGLGHTV